MCVGPECRCSHRRAYADEYAERVNRAAVLLRKHSPAEVVRALRGEFALSERQARRYVTAGLERPDGVPVPERTAVFTVRLAPSLIAGLRRHARSRGLTVSASVAEAVSLYLGQGRERRGGQAG